jgi:alpha-L-arabinofuranosidase
MDVVALVRELGSTTIRYPGGNFVSGFRWEDSVGPRDKRPVRRDLAWHSLESNQVGLDEFARWLKLTDSELMLAVNLGTRGIQPALDLLEYANHPSGTALPDLRIANGTPEPHNVRMWCFGNEMDGSWQTGFMTADDYGKLTPPYRRRDEDGRQGPRTRGLRLLRLLDADLRRLGAHGARAHLRHGAASVIDAVATADEDRAAVFLVNRDLHEPAQVTIDVRSLGSTHVTEAVTLADADVYAKNTFAEQNRVTPAPNTTAKLADGVLSIELPSHDGGRGKGL